MYLISHMITSKLVVVKTGLICCKLKFIFVVVVLVQVCVRVVPVTEAGPWLQNTSAPSTSLSR
jgi:hypothetical protein